MGFNAFVANQGSQTNILTDNTGGTSSAGTVIAVQKVDISGQGTAGTLWNGGVTGTINTGTIQSLVSGTINSATVQMSSGTLNVGTFVNNGGSIQLYDSSGSIANILTSSGTAAGQNAQLVAGAGMTTATLTLNAGSPNTNWYDMLNYPWLSFEVLTNTALSTLTFQTSGDSSQTKINSMVLYNGNTTTNGLDINTNSAGITYAGPRMGRYFRISSNVGGSDSVTIVITFYTTSAASLVAKVVAAQNGTWTVGANSAINSAVPVNAFYVGGNNNGTLVGLIAPGGTLNAGTVSAVGTMGTLGAGSIQITAGTISAGTINTGTLSPVPSIANVTYGTHGTTGVSIFGTLAGGTGSGAGTEIFVTSVSLTIPSTGGSQDCSIGWGTNGGTFQAGTGLIVRGNFPPGGGIQKTFYPPINSGTQAQLCLFQAGAGTVDVSISYFITASGL